MSASKWWFTASSHGATTAQKNGSGLRCWVDRAVKVSSFKTEFERMVGVKQAINSKRGEGSQSWVVREKAYKVGRLDFTAYIVTRVIHIANRPRNSKFLLLWFQPVGERVGGHQAVIQEMLSSKIKCPHCTSESISCWCCRLMSYRHGPKPWQQHAIWFTATP